MRNGMNYVGGRWTDKTPREVALELAGKTKDRPAAPAYRSWAGVAAALMRAGLTQPQVEIIMASKLPRWAADEWEGRWGRVPAKHLVQYLHSHLGALAWLFEEVGRDGA